MKNLPTHVDFLRLSETSRINLFIPVEFKNHQHHPIVRGVSLWYDPRLS